MPSFHYTAIDDQGRQIEGTITDASSEEAALVRIAETGYTPRSIEVVKEPKKVEDILAKVRPIKLDLIEEFSRGLATMVDAGMTVLRAIEVLALQAENPKLREALEDASNAIRNGSQLADALERHPLIFDFEYVAMIRAGERTGDLPTALVKLAEKIEADARLRKQVKAATTYPKIVAVVSFLIISFLTIWMVPKFVGIFHKEIASFPPVPGKPPPNPSLPRPTAIVMQISGLLYPPGTKNIVWLGSVLLRFIAAGALFYVLKRVYGYVRLTQPWFRHWIDGIKLKLPVGIGRLVQEIAIARFARQLSVMLGAGITPASAMESVAATAGNSLIADAVYEAQRNMLNGQPISVPLSRSKAFPPMLVRMIEVGEESGDLELMLRKAAEHYERSVEAKVKGLSSTIEPLMVVFVGMAVGACVIVAYLPMIKIYQLVQ